jgi:glycerophosphoryl diester phosphodiesterase
MAPVGLSVIAHRGASGTAPENTLAAFRRAAELGAHMVELDAQLTRDGEVVVMHDWTLDRTTDGHGKVASRTLAEIRRLDAGRWFGARYAGEPVPTLRDVLAAVELPVNVELKSCGDDGLEARVVADVEAVGAMGRIVFSSFDVESLVRLRRISLDATIGVLWTRRSLTHAFTVVERVGATALHLRKEAVDPAGVREAVARGLAVRVWTVNDPGESGSLLAAGVGAVFTDFPERFLQIARS